ncbi:MAG: ImmA/IrrE family metallo-endopeptidase [Acidobacteria bacterium]|nr:ImmA/IrrE family metallo-endopeptidase [Acidobacteriota bacterium]
MLEQEPTAIEPDWLPPASNRFREYERKALEIRRFAGTGIFERLNPHRLAELLNLKVLSLADIDQLSDHARGHLAQSDNWSAGTTTPLPDGSRVIVINDKQSYGRQSATLMEEICHTLLGHDPSVISAAKAGGRSYNETVEEEAYAVGAAALVPFRALAEFLSRGDSVDKIARHFGVTKSLIEYRMRVLDLWTSGWVK